MPCVAVVENMCHFDADGKRYYPFGKGSGSEVADLYHLLVLLEESKMIISTAKCTLSTFR